MTSKNTNIYYLLAQDIPKLNGMLTRATSAAYLPEGQSFNFYTGALAYVVDYKTAGSGKIYVYHRGKDHWYEFNIRSDLGLFDLMWNRHERILRETKTISDTPPLTFMSNGRPLKNYRIYGNTVNEESVGDLVTEGEHAGEYCVPITISGINMFDYSTTSMSYRIQWTTGNMFQDNSAVISDYISVNTGDCYSCNIELFIAGYDSDYNYIGVWNGNSFIKDYPHYHNNIKIPERCSFIRVFTYSVNQTTPTLNDRTMIVKGLTVPMIYEPYHSPVSYNLYIPEQLRKVGNKTDYIDYKSQKLYKVRKNKLKTTAVSRIIDNGDGTFFSFIVNSNGSITCNGTANKDLVFDIANVTNFSGQKILCGCPKNGSSNTYCLQNSYYFHQKLNIATDYGDNAAFTAYGNNRIQIKIFSGYCCNNLTFYPMVCSADNQDLTFEPYINNNEFNLNLPSLPTFSDTNTLSVDTNIQPSRIKIIEKL